MNTYLPVSQACELPLLISGLILSPLSRSGDPTVASVWRRQTFSAAVETCTPDMSLSILHEQVPELMQVLQGKIPSSGGVWILESAYAFSRMLHGSGASSNDAFYRAFVPELGSVLYPRQIELVKRCLKSERGETDRVGATIFPGLVKVSRTSTEPGKEETVQVSKTRSQSVRCCRIDENFPRLLCDVHR